MEVWLDEKSNRPGLFIITLIRTSTRVRMPEAPKEGPDVIVRDSRTVMYDLRWNPDIRDRIFEINLRPGDTVKDFFGVKHRLSKNSLPGDESD